MMTLSSNSASYSDVVTAVASFCTFIAGAAVATWRLLPRVKAARQKQHAMFDAVLGREAVLDSITGAELAPALPGIGVRMANVEALTEAMAEEMRDTRLVEAVERIERRLEDGETRFTDMSAVIEAMAAAKADDHQKLWDAIRDLINNRPAV